MGSGASLGLSAAVEASSVRVLSDALATISHEEAERLLKLVTETQADDRFASLVEEGGGCVIPEVELRGISVAQLRTALACAQRQCNEEGWVSTRDPGRPELLDPKTLNLYSVNTYLIKPSTSARKCSYVELVAFGSQRPIYFVSHWWGEPVAEFIDCLAQHAEDRGLQESSPNWVCAYANNQHALATEMGSSVETSPFYRALQITCGAVSIIDTGAVVFTRAWCGFELYTSLMARGTDFLHDFYTVVPAGAKGARKKAVGLVDGFAVTDTSLAFDQPNDPQAKDMRERQFPIGLITTSLQFRIKNAQASVQEDLDMILAAIADTECLDATVAARASAALLGRILEEECEGVELGTVWTALRQSNLRKLCVHLSSGNWVNVRVRRSEQLMERAQQLGQALPVALEELRLGRVGKGIIAGFVALLQRTECLATVQLENCDVSDVEVAEIAQAMLQNAAHLAQEGKRPSLRTLDLNMNSVGDIGAQMLALTLDPITSSLTSLSLGNNRIGDAGGIALGDALGKNCTLRDLCLGNNSIGKTGGCALARGLQTNSVLTTLMLSGNDVYDAGAVAFAEALNNHKCALTSLDLSFNMIADAGLDALAGALQLSQLQRLRLEGHKAEDEDAVRKLKDAWENAGSGTERNLIISSDEDVSGALAAFFS